MGLGDQIPREGRIAVTLTCARGLPDTRGRPCTRPGHPPRSSSLLFPHGHRRGGGERTGWGRGGDERGGVSGQAAKQR